MKEIKKAIKYLACAWILLCLIWVVIAEPTRYEHFTDMEPLEVFVRMSAALPIVGVILFIVLKPEEL